MPSSELLSLENISSFARRLAKSLKTQDLVTFSGDLGAGKTTLIKEIAQHLGVTETVNSPTFVYLQSYEGSLPIYHFDLYRLSDEQEFLAKGFDEYFDIEGIVFMEWPEKIPNLLPKKSKQLFLTIVDEKTRKVVCHDYISNR